MTQEPNSAKPVAEEPAPKKMSEQTAGFCMAITSAMFYTVSLSMMRGLTNYPEVSSDWSLAMKELVTVGCVTPIILYKYFRGRYVFPKWRATATVVLAGIFCQLIGARSHLVAYAAIGLALATPLIQASQLIFSSVIGAVWLKERVTKLKAFALGLLLLAVWMMYRGASGTAGEIAGKPLAVGLGLACVLATGFGYAMQLSMMRRVLRSRNPDGTAVDARSSAPTTLVMVTVCGVGLVICGSILTAQQGVGAWISPPAACWGYVLTAGVANMIGFVFQIEGLRRLFVLKQTMIANAQTVTLALFGVLFFHESMTVTSGLGIALTAIAVALAGLSKN